MTYHSIALELVKQVGLVFGVKPGMVTELRNKKRTLDISKITQILKKA